MDAFTAVPKSRPPGSESDKGWPYAQAGGGGLVCDLDVGGAIAPKGLFLGAVFLCKFAPPVGKAAVDVAYELDGGRPMGP